MGRLNKENKDPETETILFIRHLFDTIIMNNSIKIQEIINCVHYDVIKRSKVKKKGVKQWLCINNPFFNVRVDLARRQSYIQYGLLLVYGLSDYHLTLTTVLKNFWYDLWRQNVGAFSYCFKKSRYTSQKCIIESK